MSVVCDLCPICTIPTASSTASIPRFFPSEIGRTDLTIKNDVTRLLFPFATNQAGLDTALVIANVSGDVLRTLPQVGACTVRLLGIVGTTRVELVYPSPSIGPGEHFVWSLSKGGAVQATAGFQGYILVECDFPARGFGWIHSDGASPNPLPGSGFHAELLPPEND